MTAINIIRQRNAVHVLTDAAVYSTDGVVDHFNSKAFCLPHLNAVLATRGPSQALRVIGNAAGQLYSSFDEFCDGIENLLPALCDEFPEQMACEGGTRIDLLIAGWSESAGRPMSYQMVSAGNDWTPDVDDIVVQSADAFTLSEVSEITTAPPIAESDLVRANVYGPEIGGVNDMNPEIHGLMMLELQRQVRVSLIAGSEPAHWVGGFALLSTVTATGITQKVIHRWPDEVGELIQPEAVDWQAWWKSRAVGATTMTRAERRAWESRNRKAA